MQLYIFSFSGGTQKKKNSWKNRDFKFFSGYPFDEKRGISPNPLGHFTKFPRRFGEIPRLSYTQGITTHKSPRGLPYTNPLKIAVFWLSKKYQLKFLWNIAQNFMKVLVKFYVLLPIFKFRFGYLGYTFIALFFVKMKSARETRFWQFWRYFQRTFCLSRIKFFILSTFFTDSFFISFMDWFFFYG